MVQRLGPLESRALAKEQASGGYKRNSGESKGTLKWKMNSNHPRRREAAKSVHELYRMVEFRPQALRREDTSHSLAFPPEVITSCVGSVFFNVIQISFQTVAVEYVSPGKGHLVFSFSCLNPWLPSMIQHLLELSKAELCKLPKMSSIQLKRGASDKSLSPVDQQAKIDDVRKLIGPVVDKLPVLCSDASILRFLRARNWNAKKASKMLKETLKWRLQYKPEAIRWVCILLFPTEHFLMKFGFLKHHKVTHYLR
ncbi:random slug protein 5-like isoform X1 [Gossypium australe]|uniref:Random slug protein 5-like isoform X1 n=1 Tax=Gossypium australe TaxID=47621 RepID=A0A5B6WZS2_9ROSI|nr:random slug protein 5-like isoform X1 [Gossypium australe]